MKLPINTTWFWTTKSSTSLQALTREWHVFMLVVPLLIIAIGYQNYLIGNWGFRPYLQDIMSFLTQTFMLLAIAWYIFHHTTDKKALKKMYARWYK